VNHQKNKKWRPGQKQLEKTPTVEVPSLHLMKPLDNQFIPMPPKVPSKITIPHPPDMPPPDKGSMIIARRKPEDFKREGSKVPMPPRMKLEQDPEPPKKPPPPGVRQLEVNAFDMYMHKKQVLENKKKRRKKIPPFAVFLAQALCIFQALWMSGGSTFYVWSLGQALKPRIGTMTIYSWFVAVIIYFTVFEAIKCVCITLNALSKEESKRRLAIREARRIRMTLKQQCVEEGHRIRGLPKSVQGL